MISARLISAVFLLFVLAAGSAFGQSSDQNFPSPVTESEIASTIRARDLGDARLTTHYWVFDGSQGDIFVNVATQNFSGDIDVYQASDLKPLAKMVIYADSGINETGRVVYLRQPARLLLRVQGRTPNDDPATYKIKFAGSFVALAPQKQEGPPTVASTEDTGIKVNSVGTIISVIPKSVPVASPSPEREVSPSRTATKPPEKPADDDHGTTARQSNDDDGVKTIFGNRSKSPTTKPPATATSNPPVRRTRPPARRTEAPVDPMAGYMLVIVFKDGTRSEREMTEVLRFVYDRGFLTVVGKGGKLDKYAATTVASVTVQQP